MITEENPFSLRTFLTVWVETGLGRILLMKLAT